MNVDGFKIDKNDTEKLLHVTFDRKLTFDDQISDIFKKAGRKISALARVTPYMGIAKEQFSFCPLVWMCHSRANNNKINRLHGRCLRTVFI